ncbi:O-antigen ligase family protein [Peribacillus simplex]
MVSDNYKSTPITNRLINVNSFLIAIILSANIIALALNKFIQIDNLIILPFLLCTIISLVINDKKNFVVVVPVTTFFLMLFLISFFQLGFSAHLLEYLMTFLIYGVCSFFIGTQPYNSEKVMTYIVVIYAVLAWVFFGFNIETLLPGNKMGLGYLILPVILASIYHLTNPVLIAKKKFFLILVILWYGYLMLLAGSRGAILSIGLFVGIMIILRSKTRLKKMLFLFLVFATTFWVYVNFLNILIFIRDILINFGLKSNFIEKFIITITTGNIDNGRLDLYTLTIERFKEKWIYGNGIGNYHDVYGTYIHNIFLQILDESGLFLALPVFFIILYGFFIIFFSKNSDKNYRFFIGLLFASSIPKLALSSIFWKEQTFWLFFIIIFSNFAFGPKKINNN